jgi:hypothetical protein
VDSISDAKARRGAFTNRDQPGGEVMSQPSTKRDKWEGLWRFDGAAPWRPPRQQVGPAGPCRRLGSATILPLLQEFG